MRIGMVTGEYPPMQGGVGAYSHILAGELAQQGHSVFVFSSTPAQNTNPAIQLTNSAAGWNLAGLRAIGRWANTAHIDVINLQFQTAAYQMSPWIHFLPDWTHVPVVTTFHDLRFPYLFPKAGRLRGWIVMHLARTSAGVIVTNHEDWERLKHLPNASLIPIGSNILTPLPADFDRRTWRETVGAVDNDFVIAYFGFMNRSKGVDVLLNSLAELRSQNIPARLLLVGGRTGTSDPTNAAHADEIDALIARLNLAPYIHWTGFADEQAVSAYLGAADVVALPFRDGASYRRGSLMAAIHQGCAIVTTTPQVNIPTFKHAANMLLVPPGNALTDALCQLYRTPDLCERLKQGARELDKQFDWSQIARDCVVSFERALTRKP